MSKTFRLAAKEILKEKKSECFDKFRSIKFWVLDYNEWVTVIGAGSLKGRGRENGGEDQGKKGGGCHSGVHHQPPQAPARMVKP